MRRRNITRIIAILSALLLTMCFAACGNVNNTIAEPEEITVEYLYGEYAEQLVRDGAEITLGTVSIADNGNSNYTITTAGMVIVESDITDAGYYIADKNISTALPLDPSVRITYINDAGTGPEIISLEDFMTIVNDESYDPLKEGSEQLYDVYSIGGTALMILAKELPAGK